MPFPSIDERSLDQSPEERAFALQLEELLSLSKESLQVLASEAFGKLAFECSAGNAGVFVDNGEPMSMLKEAVSACRAAC